MLNTYNMTLADTIPYMNSKDYKERFIGEYWQTRIRYDKLHDMTVNYEADKLTFTPSCSLDLLKEQKKYMGMYLNKLEIRASIEEIDLEQPFKVKAKENKNASDIPFVTGLSIEGEDNHQYTIEELDNITTSTHTDGWVAASEEINSGDSEWEIDEVNKEVDEEDLITFTDIIKFFEVGEKVIHDTYGIGKIKGIWYDIEEKNPSWTMEIKWNNGANCILDSTIPCHLKIMSELIIG